MDPNESLKRILALAHAQQKGDKSADPDELADEILNLDEWLKHGGYLPRDWERR